MSMSSPSLTESRSREKLLVVRFLQAHLAHEGIDQHSYDMLYRMILMTSSLGRDLYAVSQANIADASIVKKMEWHAGCLLEGCEAFRRHLEKRLRNARHAATKLPELDGTTEEALTWKLSVWHDESRKLHVPTGNDARLFRYLANHFDDAVYRDYLQLRRCRPELAIWSMTKQLTAVQQTLETVIDRCLAADNVVLRLEEECELAFKRLKRSARGQVKPLIVTSDLQSKPVEMVINFESTAIMDSPLTDSGPPQLPPLPFQTPSSQAVVAQQHLAPLITHDTARHPVSNKSFSAVEEQVAQRGHHRKITIADSDYTADATSSFGLGILQPQPRNPHRGPPTCALRKGSVGNTPRVFTGSFNELESTIFDLKLHKVKTPEDQPGSPVLSSSPTDGPLIRDFADATRTPSLCPSPVTLLHRREALVSRDAQWESREVNGEMVRSRRPSEKMQRSQTIDERSNGLEEWLSQHLPAELSSPETPGSAVKRGFLRQRENTL